MLKIKKVIYILVIALCILNLICLDLFAQTTLRSTGIGIRGSFWNLPDLSHQHTTNYSNEYISNVTVGGVGGWLNFFSRVNNNSVLEFNLGAVAKVKVEEGEDYSSNENVDVTAITPFLIGLRYNFLPHINHTSVRPYFSLGGGPYWITHINVEENMAEEEVSVKTKLERGVYLGGGINFMLCSWCVINFDVRYHYMDFNINDELSGFEGGLGFSFMWGNFEFSD